jgi:hypothetical protein
MAQKISVLGIDLATLVCHVVGMDVVFLICQAAANGGLW